MTREPAQFWIGSASHDHVRKGVEGGFCQLSHGRPEALRRMQRGDWIAYYSGREVFGESAPCQKFTALGRITGEDVYQVTMAEGFRPYRRDTHFYRTKSVDIHPLIATLRFIKNKQYWGLPFRRGFLTVSEADFRRIAEAMLGRPVNLKRGALARSRRG